MFLQSLKPVTPQMLHCPHKYPGAPQHSFCQDAQRKRQCSSEGRKGRVREPIGQTSSEPSHANID